MWGWGPPPRPPTEAHIQPMSCPATPALHRPPDPTCRRWSLWAMLAKVLSGKWALWGHTGAGSAWNIEPLGHTGIGSAWKIDPSGSLWIPLGSFWVSSGFSESLWVPSGSPLGHCWVPSGALHIPSHHPHPQGGEGGTLPGGVGVAPESCILF